MNTNQSKFLEQATNHFGANAVVARSELCDFALASNFKRGSYRWIFKDEYRASHGKYKLPAVSGAASVDITSIAAMAADIVPIRKAQPVATTIKFDPNAV